MIPNDEDMDRLLKLLIHSLSTLDWIRGSANNLLKVLNKKAVKDYKSHSGVSGVSVNFNS